MNDNRRDERMPETKGFRPYILGHRDFDEEVFHIDTALVVVAPEKAITPKEFTGADKVAFYVARPGNLQKLYTVTGEFSCSTGEDYSEVSIMIYNTNDISEDLGRTFVKLPLRFIAEIRSKNVS